MKLEPEVEKKIKVDVNPEKVIINLSLLLGKVYFFLFKENIFIYKIKKCVFFPNCNKADCLFFHPTE